MDLSSPSSINSSDSNRSTPLSLLESTLSQGSSPSPKTPREEISYYDLVDALDTLSQFDGTLKGSDLKAKEIDVLGEKLANAEISTELFLKLTRVKAVRLATARYESGPKEGQLKERDPPTLGYEDLMLRDQTVPKSCPSVNRLQVTQVIEAKTEAGVEFTQAELGLEYFLKSPNRNTFESKTIENFSKFEETLSNFIDTVVLSKEKEKELLPILLRQGGFFNPDTSSSSSHNRGLVYERQPRRHPPAFSENVQRPVKTPDPTSCTLL